MSFALGQVIGDYEFVDVVRSSHSAVSYRVRNLAESRDELLKVVVADPRRDSDLIQRFLRESRIHSGLRHPNILTCYKAFELQSRLVMTMEMVEAVTLEDRLQADRLSLEETCNLMQQMLRALAFAHDCSIVHRELTPSNILLTPDGIAKLSGFNLACVASDPRLTQVGAVVGPIHYMSPEQVRSEAVDARSDIYALGVVLYEILAGRKPFNGKSHFDVLAAHVSTPAPSLAAIRPDLSAEMCSVVERALAKDPADRFQTCMEFAGGLHRAANPAPKKTAEEIAGVSAAEPARRPVSKVGAGARPEAISLLTEVVEERASAPPMEAPDALAALSRSEHAAPQGKGRLAATADAIQPEAIQAPAIQESSLLLQRPLVTLLVTILFILASSWLISRLS